jgi:hypothetical protein
MKAAGWMARRTTTRNHSRFNDCLPAVYHCVFYEKAVMEERTPKSYGSQCLVFDVVPKSISEQRNKAMASS